MALATGAELADLFDKNVTVVHNPTDSALIDLAEVLLCGRRGFWCRGLYPGVKEAVKPM